MNTNQIHCFVAAAERQSFSAAAASLFLTPQAVSKQILALEEELQTRLFLRNGSKLTLTESGKLFKSHFEAQERQFQFLREDVRLHESTLRSRLSLGLSEWLDPFSELGVPIQRFFRENDRTAFRFYHLSNAELLRALHEGTIDCAIFSGAQMPSVSDACYRIIARETICLFAPSDIPGGDVSRDCWGLPMLTTPAWSWLRSECRLLETKEYTSVNLEPAEICTAPTHSSLLAEMRFRRTVTLGGGRFTPLLRIPGLTPHPLPITDDIHCQWLRTNENPLMSEFAEYMSGYFGIEKNSEKL